MGYHNVEIPRGEFGEFSKIKEEYCEARDALNQDAKIMLLCEFADMIGAIEGYVIKHFDMTLDDVLKMKDLNKRAFEDGTRVSKQD
jgi:phosphoribosyl-ATP pyrophosphohydrolase